MKLALSFAAAAAAIPAGASAAGEDDRSAIAGLEAQWYGALTAQVAGELLAEDFARPMANGQIWSKAEQIAWLRDRPPVPGPTGRVERLDTRFYGEVAVATGIATIVGPEGRELDRNMFTDVYVKRDGRWQMVSAQRTQVAQR